MLSLDKVTVKADEQLLLSDVSFSIQQGESLAIVGPSGSGKTILAKTLAGYYRLASGTLQYHLHGKALRIFVPQQHDFRSFFPERTYYQQRYDHNYGSSMPSVADIHQKLLKANPSINQSDIDTWMKVLNAEQLKDRKLLELSNGEGKRIQLVNALSQKPGVLILDNPYVGLDKSSRSVLTDIIQQHLPADTLIILITSPEEIPDHITQVLELEQGRVKGIFPGKGYIPSWEEEKISLSLDNLSLFRDPAKENFKVAVELNNLTMGYGDAVILKNITWKVNKGERWALRGHNGSGKSTLISLLNGDNPQGYGKELYLFDKKKGSGESIWELKEKIGYVSPELHLYFKRDPSYTEALAIDEEEVSSSAYHTLSVTCFEVICSGYNEMIGMAEKMSDGQLIRAKEWMKALGLEALAKRSYYALSNGEQRLTLLARALVKNPPLLILDEPCQGLDKAQSQRFIALVDQLCTKLEKTLIYVSHYDHELPKCVDQVMELRQGNMAK